LCTLAATDKGVF